MVVRNLFGPEHLEMRLGHLVAGRQVEPDLEQLKAVFPIALQQWKHFGVHDAAPGSQPLHVAATEARCRAQ